MGAVVVARDSVGQLEGGSGRRGDGTCRLQPGGNKFFELFANLESMVDRVVGVVVGLLGSCGKGCQCAEGGSSLEGGWSRYRCWHGSTRLLGEVETGEGTFFRVCAFGVCHVVTAAASDTEVRHHLVLYHGGRYCSRLRLLRRGSCSCDIWNKALAGAHAQAIVT